MQDHYNITPSPDGDYYCFTTDQKKTYNLILSEHHLLGLKTLSFLFETNSEKNGGDERVRNTIIEFIRRVIVEQYEVIIFTCETIDKKHLCRNRKFNGWFTIYNTNMALGCEKHNSSIVTLDDDNTYYASMIIRSDHPLKQNYIDAFKFETDPQAFGK